MLKPILWSDVIFDKSRGQVTCHSADNGENTILIDENIDAGKKINSNESIHQIICF